MSFPPLQAGGASKRKEQKDNTEENDKALENNQVLLHMAGWEENKERATRWAPSPYKVDLANYSPTPEK